MTRNLDQICKFRKQISGSWCRFPAALRFLSSLRVGSDFFPCLAEDATVWLPAVRYVLCGIVVWISARISKLCHLFNTLITLLHKKNGLRKAVE